MLPKSEIAVASSHRGYMPKTFGGRPKVTETVLRHGIILEHPDYENNADSANIYESSCGESDETASDCLSVTESRSEISLDDGISTTSNSSGYEYDHMIKFHCKEFQKENGFKGNIVHPLAASESISPIVSRKGSTRGVKGRVRAAIANFRETVDDPRIKNWSVLEKGKVVLYVTSLAVCRGPFLRCLEIRKIFHNLMVKFTEYDLYMNREYLHDLRERLGPEKADYVPHLFIEGQYVGDYDVLHELSESGQLRSILKPYKRYGVAPPCQRCGGFSVVPCAVCYGSKKSNHRNTFTDQFHALRCSACDTDGLQPCPLCTDAKT